MKTLLFILLFFTTLYSNDTTHSFAPSTDCKECHATIYNEFSNSVHHHSTPQKDPIHKAVWDKHPQKNKKGQYVCGKCHTPTANNLDAMLTKGQKALPDANNTTHQAGISCAYCHRIESIELHKKSNTNIIAKEAKNYFGTLKDHIESPYHKIKTSGNDLMKNGNVCIGCHSHKMNKWGLNVCSTNIDNEMDGTNCVSCHMPKVKGSVSEFKDTSVHAFHGFAGVHNHSEMLAKYINISLEKNKNSFSITIQNHSSHALLLHPLRLAVLKVDVVRANKKIQLKDTLFARVIGKDGKPAMPWVADTTIKNTMIQGGEKRVIEYTFTLEKDDTINTTLGYYLVNPKVVQSLNLQDDNSSTKFYEFKKSSF